MSKALSASKRFFVCVCVCVCVLPALNITRIPLAFSLICFGLNLCFNFFRFFKN